METFLIFPCKSVDSNNVNPIDEHRDISLQQIKRTNNEATNSNPLEDVCIAIKGSNDENRDVSTRYSNNIEDNREIFLAKLDTMNNEVTHFNPTIDMLNSKTGPSDVNMNESHYKTLSEKEAHKNNAIVGRSIFDTNPAHLIR